MATPQGDPLGPLVMALWVLIWKREVDRRGGSQTDGKCAGKGREDEGSRRRGKGKGGGRRLRDKVERLYMDDRTWAEDGAAKVLSTKQAWEGWSEQVGLHESQAKAQLMAYTETQEQALRQEADGQNCGNRVVKALEVLGVTAVPAKGKPVVDKEKQNAGSCDHIAANKSVAQWEAGKA